MSHRTTTPCRSSLSKASTTIRSSTLAISHTSTVRRKAPFYTKSDHCTKTGSGQTQETQLLRKKVVFADDWDQSILMSYTRPRAAVAAADKPIISGVTSYGQQGESSSSSSSETKTAKLTGRIEAWKAARMEEYSSQVRKRHFLRHLYIKCIILPRQARDKHRENSKKVPFSRSCCLSSSWSTRSPPCRTH